MLSTLLYIIAGFLGLVVLGTAWVLAVFIPRLLQILEKDPPLLGLGCPPEHEDELFEAYEACEVPTADGQTLRGTYLPTFAERRMGVVAFCHELTTDRRMALRYVEGLRNDGFDIFTFDFRNHGTSDSVPGYRPMQWLSNYDVIDVQAVVDYLCARPDADPAGVGLMGISKGGSASLYVAGNDPRVKAVVTDGAYTNILLMAYNVKRFVPLFITWDWVRRRTPDFLCNTLPWWARLWLGKRLGCKLMNVESTARRVRQPVFMVHGLSDNMVPLEVARKLRERLSGPSKLWVVPHAKHNTAVFIAAHDYYGRLSRFFARHLSDTQAEEPAWNPVLAVFSRRKAATRAPRRMPVHSTAGTE